MKSYFTLILFLSIGGFAMSQTWESVSGLPGGFDDARHHPVTFSIDGFGYVMGGTVLFLNSDDFMRYDPNTDTWENLPNFPGEARSFSIGSARGSKAYLGFGLSASQNALNDLWEYDSETETWTELASCPCEARLHPAFVQLGDKIYVGMGNSANGNLNDWWEYDITEDSWSRKADLPGLTRHHPFHFGIGDIAYVGLGHGDDVNGFVQVYTDFYSYDPSLDEWTRLGDFPDEGRVAGTQFDYNGKGYILSGDGEFHTWTPDGVFWEYTPETDTWMELPSHPGGSRWAPGSFVIDNYVYLIAGESAVQLESDMFRFELEPLSTNTEEILTPYIEVFPNPTSGVFYINHDLSEFSAVRLLNSHGQEILDIQSNIVHLEEKASGLYYLQFVKDSRTTTRKLLLVD